MHCQSLRQVIAFSPAEVDPWGVGELSRDHDTPFQASATGTAVLPLDELPTTPHEVALMQSTASRKF